MRDGVRARKEGEVVKKEGDGDNDGGRGASNGDLIVKSEFF